MKVVKQHILIITCSPVEVYGSTNPREEFQYAVELDVAGKYWMFWTPDDETKTITFEVVSFMKLSAIA